MAKLDFDFLSALRLRWVGYALLILSLIDSLSILIPLRLMDPVWELQTIGTVIERVPVLLMGLGLIFVGEQNGRRKLETLVLSGLSWFCLLLALLFMLMVPLGIVSAVRVNNQVTQGINTQLQQQLSQLERSEQQVRQSQPQNPNALKQQLLNQVESTKKQVRNEANAAKTGQQRSLLKNAVKWTLGAIISSTLFFMFWRTTAWARQMSSKL